MEEIHLSKKEIEHYPLFYLGKSNEAEIREYNSYELLKIFHFYNQNKVDTLKLIEINKKELSLVPELLLFKKYIYEDNDLISGILINKGYPINLQNYAQGGGIF